MSCSTVVELDTDMPTDRGTLGKGRMVFTGPQGSRDHQMTVLDGTYVGEGFETREKTADLNYLLRAPADHIPARQSQSVPFGSIGWGVPKKQDFAIQQSGNQIVIGEAGPFRQRTEDRYTHRLQQPYYPVPEPSNAAAQKSSSFRTSQSNRTALRPSSSVSEEGRPQSSRDSSRPSTGSHRSSDRR